eukprot:6138819-Pyramimonas_sp.AAC.1
MQEHHIFDDQLASASSWSIRHGWKSLFLPADRGPHGGPSAGVAILVRSGLGLHALQSGMDVAKHRAIAG